VNSPFTIRHRPIGWVLPVSLMMAAVGFMGSTAWINTLQFERNRDAIKDKGIPVEIATDAVKLADRVKSMETEVTKLRAENTKLQASLGSQNSSSKELNKSLQDIKRISAMTEVIGVGVVVTLRDSEKTSPSPEFSDKIVHDIDILKVVNEMWSSGAEAIAIDDRRVGPGTSIRCVGPTVLVDQEKIATPIRIQAIGNQKNLMGGLQLPGGVIAELRQMDPAMVRIEAVNQMKLPAWTGPTSWKVGKVPEDSTG